MRQFGQVGLRSFTTTFKHQVLKQLEICGHIMIGNTVVKKFESQQAWIPNDSRMVPVYDKLTEIEELLICTTFKTNLNFQWQERMSFQIVMK